MYNNHKVVIDMIENHYHINNSRQFSDLSEKDKRQLANLILQDFDYFDPAEIILYNPDDKKDTKKVNNLIKILNQLHYGAINEKKAINKLYKLIMNEKTISSINELFDEVIDRYEIKPIESEWENKMDAILGFI